MSKQTADLEMPQAFELADLCSGTGQKHTDKYGGTFDVIRWDDIADMMKNPPSVAKESARWAIFSDRLTRTHAKQRQEGTFYVAWADFDEDPMPLGEAIIAATTTIPGDLYAYSSSSATKEKQKGRLLIPLAEPCPGEDFVLLQEAINDRLDTAGLTPDRVTERAGQLCYLPNRGEFYEKHILDGVGPLDWRAEFAVELEALRNQVAEEEAQHQAAMQAAKAKREQRQATLSSGQISPVDEYNACYAGAKEAWIAYGAKWRGRRGLSPYSDSSSPALTVSSDGRLWHSHHGSDLAANVGTPDRNGGGCWGDAFDLYVHFDHGGDYDAAVKAAGDTLRTAEGVTINKHNQRLYMQAQAPAAPDDFDSVSPAGVVPSRDANSLAWQINKSLAEQVVGVDLKAAGVEADATVIEAMIAGAFWSGARSRLFLLNEQQTLVEFTGQDAAKFITKRFGTILDRKALEQAVAHLPFGNSDSETGEESQAAKEKRKKFIASCIAMATDTVIEHIKYKNQRNNVEWHVDMFADAPRLELKEDKARVVLTHVPFDGGQVTDDATAAEAVADYKKHFPRFDEFLMFLVAARFAIDRKKAYLWILADSDWGKGLLIDGILGRLDATVPMSVKEVEGVFEGKPAGKSPSDFKRAFALVIDEFKAVKAEIKQLQSHIDLAPKFQLTSRVELFAKVFMSAESVASLVTENGVEDQFANRMSIFKETGTIDEREAFRRIGRPQYVRALVAYAADYLNQRIAEMQAMGREGAEDHASRWLDGFIGRNGIDTVYERFSDSLADVAEEAVQHFMADPAVAQWAVASVVVQDTASGEYYLTRPRKSLDSFLEDRFSHSEVGAYKKRKPEILEHMSADGRGEYPHRPNGRQVRAVKLKKMR